MPAAGIGAKRMSDIVSEQTIDLDPAGSDLRPPISDSTSSLAIGQVLRGRYVLQEHLGAGGKGSVFKALDRFRATLPDAQQYVALKVLNAGDCSEQTLANLRREFHCGQALSHPNIVNVYELDCDGDVVFFTMELLDGEPLSAVIERFSPKVMRKAQAWQLIQQLGAGLAHAHERGVVHGDLKPRNIFITREGELRILDFGAAHGFKPSKSRSEHADHVPTSGTPAYASCEQLEGRRADPRDDFYALACICYELLAGTHPFGSRPATLARDYRVSLVRPQGLTGTAVESSAERPVLASSGALDQRAFMDASIDERERRRALGDTVARSRSAEPVGIQGGLARGGPVFGGEPDGCRGMGAAQVDFCTQDG